MKHIHIENLTVTYRAYARSKEALKGVDLSVNEGEIFGFLGPNGAGKTTTIKTLLGLNPLYGGTVTILGKTPADLSHKHRIGYMPETADYYWYLSPRELLRYCGWSSSPSPVRAPWSDVPPPVAAVVCTVSSGNLNPSLVE